MRLDVYLHEENLAESRERAKALIMAGQVYVNGEKADKAGTKVPQNADVEVRGEPLAYVSRGGLKLEKALQVFDVSPEGKVCMDVGASTGGFTDCMLQNGARRVYAVDVGYGQLAWKLRNDPRVVVWERSNIRHLPPEKIEDKIEFFTIDTSFISLKLVLLSTTVFLSDNSEGVCLVKPQFEAGKDKVGKGGVVKDPAVHCEVLQNVFKYASDNGFTVLNMDYSPIKGPKGNIEYLMHVGREPAVLEEETNRQRKAVPFSEQDVAALVERAQRELNV